MIPAIFIRLILAALIFVGLRLAIPAFVGILGYSLDANWKTLVDVACAAVAIWYVIAGKPQSIT
jgi:hypothetical protein